MAKQLPSSVHSALDYRARLQSTPRYDLSDIYPQTGKRSLVLNESKSEVLEFEVPPRCINLARSKLEFAIQMQTKYKEGATPPENHLDVIHVNTGHLSIVDRIEVYTRTGVRLMDLDRQQLWSKISNTYFADPDNYREAGEHYDASKGFGYREIGTQQRWFRTQESDVTTEVKKDLVDSKVVSNFAKNNYRDQYNNVPSADKQLMQMTPWQLFHPGGASGATSGTLTFKKKFTIDLSDFRDSILSVDKSLFFGGQVLMIKMHISGYDDFIIAKGDQSDINFTPTVSTTPLPQLETKVANTKPWSQDLKTDGTVGYQKADTEISLQDINLRCAFESNPIIISQIKSKVMSKEGLKLFVPYVYSFEEPRNNPNGKLSQIVRLNRGHGLRVQRFCFTTTPSHTAAAVKLKDSANYWHTSQAFQPDVDNKLVDKSMVKSYYTTLNNKRLQERDIVVKDADNFFTADSYNYIHPIVEGSLADDQDAHLENWAHIDAFDAYNCKKVDHTNIVAGLPLSDDMQYVVNADVTCNAPTINLNTFAVVQRSLRLKADSITLV